MNFNRFEFQLRLAISSRTLIFNSNLTGRWIRSNFWMVVERGVRVGEVVDGEVFVLDFGDDVDGVEDVEEGVFEVGGGGG